MDSTSADYFIFDIEHSGIEPLKVPQHPETRQNYRIKPLKLSPQNTTHIVPKGGE
jgi:hypothetical protein